MQKFEMIREFVCPGCVNGCDNDEIQQKIESGFERRQCPAHVVGTMMMGVGMFALGLPRGFCRTGTTPYQNELISTLDIRVYPEGEFEASDHWNTYNIPVWAKIDNGFLFVKVISPRINRIFVLVIERGTLDMAAGALDVSDEEMD